MDSDLERFFDESYYALADEARKLGMRPFDHYISIGEARGYPPSRHFDPSHYAQTYADLRSYEGSLLSHYVRYGKAEGRSPLPGPSEVPLNTSRIKKSRPTVLVVIHEASRTGAPILAWNLIRSLRADFNVVAILMKEGPIEADLKEVSSALVKVPADLGYASDRAFQIFRKIVATYKPEYAIANSVATRHAALLLEELGVPVIALVHEFSTDFQPVGTLHGLYLSASRIVFSAKVVAAASCNDYHSIRFRNYLIAPQGIARPPVSSKVQKNVTSPPHYELKNIGRDAFVVVGMGTVTFRKGVDVFVAVAAELRRKHPKVPWKFIWVGHVYSFDALYKAYIKHQISIGGLDDHFILMDEVTDLSPIYRKANAFLLSSRLDPLPNVAVDAALYGLPIVSFNGAGGIAEFLGDDPRTRSLAVPYLDVGAAAGVLFQLSNSSKFLKSASRAIKANARKTFDMSRYVATLMSLGRECVEERQQILRDLQTILDADVFNARFCFGADEQDRPIEESVLRYLNKSRVARPLQRARTGLYFRRPMIGFNPLIYASDVPEMRSTSVDPLAHFLRAGRPAGRWSHQVIFAHTRPQKGTGMRVALHGHFHYPELVGEFLDRLILNKTPIELILTTTGRAQGRELEQALKARRIRNAQIHVVTNRGRDIGPFFEIFRKQQPKYDVVGHIHSKKSTHVAPMTGDRWREFALQHLVGGVCAMADVILDHFANDPELGLVFPEDPHLNDWDENRALADLLARKMKLKMPLPTHFDFPIGSMFWARPAALKALFDLNLGLKDYPEEPLPADGTILHAIERLIPFSAEKAGYRYATSHVPGSLR